jgi:DNA invertase Pin-like site-specific DNA recombinase
MGKKKEPKKESVIYTRFSPRRHADTCESLDTQFEYCTSHCKLHNMAVIGSYEDEALSGANADNRPGLQSAIEHAIRAKACLVFYSLSRLARSTRDALQIAERLTKGNATLCSVKETFDTSTPMGQCMFTVMSAFNELDRMKISECTSDAMLRHQASGRRMSATLPYGWRKDPDNDARMLPDERERKIIDKIMFLREEPEGECRAWTLREIAVYLDAKEGFHARPTTKMFKDKPVTVKGKWAFGTIRSIIRRETQDMF